MFRYRFSLLVLSLFLTFGGGCLAADNYCASASDACCSTYTFSFDPMASFIEQRTLGYLRVSGNETPTVFNIPPQWEFGYRLGFEYRPCERWGVKVAYTHQDQEHSTRKFFAAGGAETLDTAFVGNQIFVDNDDVSLSTSYQMDYDLLDITTSWSCCSCEGLEWAPYGGLRALWFRGKANQELVNPDLTSGFSRVDYDAYGLVAGVALNYQLNGCFGLSGYLAGSVISGDLESNRTAAMNNTPATEILQQHDILTTNSVEGGVKFLYDWYFCGCCNQIGLGYEATRWSDELPNTFSNNGTSAFFIQSITGYISVGF